MKQTYAVRLLKCLQTCSLLAQTLVMQQRTLVATLLLVLLVAQLVTAAQVVTQVAQAFRVIQVVAAVHVVVVVAVQVVAATSTLIGRVPRSVPNFFKHHRKTNMPNISKWLADNSQRADSLLLQVEVIPTATVKEKLLELTSTEQKAEILFEIVKPQTDKTLREITVAELKDLALNFKDGL